MTQVEAYSFRSRLDLGAMHERLNSAGSMQWGLGESETYGPILTARPFGDRTRLRIVENEGRFHFDVVFRSEDPRAEGSWQALRGRVLGELLPLLGADDVRPCGSLD